MATWPDIINCAFEFSAGMLLWLNVYRLAKDKQVHGVHVAPVAIFALWGYWNLIFYPVVNAWLSFFAGILVVLANTSWLIQIVYYWRRQRSNNA